MLIAGEPGIGKSRLLTAFQEQVSREAPTTLLHFCLPNSLDSALHPFIAQIERASQFNTHNSEGTN